MKSTRQAPIMAIVNMEGGGEGQLFDAIPISHMYICLLAISCGLLIKCDQLLAQVHCFCTKQTINATMHIVSIS